MYRNWSEMIPPSIEVCAINLPGREGRFREQPHTRMDMLIQDLADGLSDHLGTSYAFLGHSMGAMIAFELARELRRRTVPGPAYLFVSGRQAPHVPDPDPPKYNLPDTEFIEELRTLAGTPPEVLEHPELMELMLPLLRADFELVDTYVCREEPPLDCPISAFGGLGDPETRPEELAAWREQTSGTFRMRLLPGNHFFLNDHLLSVLRGLLHDLESFVAAP